MSEKKKSDKLMATTLGGDELMELFHVQCQECKHTFGEHWGGEGDIHCRATGCTCISIVLGIKDIEEFLPDFIERSEAATEEDLDRLNKGSQ